MGRAIVLGIFSAFSPSDLDNSKARVYCACSYSNSNIFYCLCGTESTENGVGRQVLNNICYSLKHIQNVQHEHGIQNVQHGYETSHVVLAVGASGDCFF